MNTEQRIEKFNKENSPFYLVDHGKEYSLCLLLGGTPTAAAEYGQYAFDHYAEVAGRPIEENGWLTYGDGYDWECVFKKAYENDPSFHKVYFDCESSGFFCISEDLSVLESFGKSFKGLCENHDEFIKLVESAMSEAEAEVQSGTSEQEDYINVRKFIEQHPNNAFKMLTPMGYISVNSEQASKLLSGEQVIAFHGAKRVENMINAEDLLSLPVNYWRIETSAEGDTCYMMVNLPPIEEEQNPTMLM